MKFVCYHKDTIIVQAPWVYSWYIEEKEELCDKVCFLLEKQKWVIVLKDKIFRNQSFIQH
jgi:hypothetical protein